MPLVEWFRLWLFPPAPPADARVTQAPAIDEGMTPMVTEADIPPERRAILLGVQERHHRIINRLTAARGRQQLAERERRDDQEGPP